MPEATIGPEAEAPKQESEARPAGFFRRLGPGLISGAADDDPSGIATYSQVGAQFGFAMLWTMLFSFPLMVAIQEICARLGRISGLGLAGNLRRCYPPKMVYGVVLLLCLASLFNLGADVAAMAAAAQLILGGRAEVYAAGFGIASLAMQVWIPYRKYIRYLRWLTWSLFSYVATAFIVHVPWSQALRATIVPSMSFETRYLMALVGVLGTTISPYLFFWQSSEEVEEIRIHKEEWPLKRKPSQALAQFRRIALDTRVGMGFSNLVSFFIILATAATLHRSGAGNTIQTSADAAKALEPLAGHLASFLFALGIMGTGLLAIPVLAGSTAYAVSEALRWRASLERKPHEAAKFYGVLCAATVLGITLNFFGLDPIRALFLAAVLNGIVAVPLMFLVMRMSGNKKIVGQFRLPAYLRVGGWVATLTMLAASLGFLAGIIASWF